MNAIILAVIAISVMTVNSGCQAASCRVGDPILLVPGITGSQLNVKHSGFTLCNTLRSFLSLWVSKVRVTLGHGCFSEEMMLDFDGSTGLYSQRGADDISVQVPGFGDTNTVEELSMSQIIQFPRAYLRTLVEYFVERGYERGVNIRAAPYDWRLGPEELERRGYYENFKELIETMYAENGNTKVTLVIHSMGGPITLYFLTSGIVNQAWKDKYIGNYVTLSGAWAGGNEALLFQISGLSLVNERSDDLFFLIQKIGGTIRRSLKPIVRSFQSTSVLTPHPLIWGNTVLVTTPTQNYSANDYQALFNDINYPEGYDKFEGIEDVNRNWPAPNVSTHCYYGVGVDTPVSFQYSKPFPQGANDVPAHITMGDGDGSVPVLSLKVCLRWKNHNGGHRFQSMAFRDVDHQQIVSSDTILKKISNIVGASTNPCPTPPPKKKKSLWNKVKSFFG